MSEFLYRRNTVLESLRANRRRIITLWLEKGTPPNQSEPILRLAKQRGVSVKTADKARLTQLADDASHQGVVLEVGPYPYSDVNEMLDLAAEQGEKPFLLLLDLIQGPQNVGMLLRTAEAVGVQGVIMQERRAPDVTPQLVLFSAGAAEHLLIARVTNLVQTMNTLKEAGVWLVGLDLGDDAEAFGRFDLDRPLGLVVGHEGSGLRRLVRETCDVRLRLPMRGRVASLNAAAAGSIVLYGAWQARGFPS